MKRRKKVFTVRARFAKGDVVFQKGMNVALKVQEVMLADPMYATNDGRFYGEDELRAPRRKKQK